MTQIILLYFVGASIGMVVGYLIAFLMQHGAVIKAGVGLNNFHTLIMEDKGVRNITTLYIAVGVIPFAVLGGWAGSHWAKRKPVAAQVSAT